MEMIRTTADLTFQDFLRYPALRVEEGEFAFVTGRSGAGKSTYLRLLNGSIPADPGCIFYRGIPLEEYQILPYRRQVLLVPQAVYLIPGTILDNFHFYYDVRRQQRIDGERAAEFLRRCCLDFPVDTSCDTLSGGERQRVFLAIFLSLATDVVLLDEPTAALDEATARQVLANIKEYCKGKGLTALCICHSPKLVETFADRVMEVGGAQ